MDCPIATRRGALGHVLGSSGHPIALPHIPSPSERGFRERWQPRAAVASGLGHGGAGKAPAPCHPPARALSHLMGAATAWGGDVHASCQQQVLSPNPAAPQRPPLQPLVPQCHSPSPRCPPAGCQRPRVPLWVPGLQLVPPGRAVPPLQHPCAAGCPTHPPPRHVLWLSCHQWGVCGCAWHCSPWPQCHQGLSHANLVHAGHPPLHS